MMRLVLFGAMLLSLAVPGGALAIISYADADSTPSAYDKDEIIDIHNDLGDLAVSSVNHPTKETAAKAHELNAKALSWAERYEADPVWEEFAAATAAMAAVLARDVEKPGSVTDAEWNAAIARIDQAENQLPVDRHPEDG